MRRAAFAAGVAAFGLGCATAPVLPGPARVSVEVLGGLAPEDVAPPLGAPVVVILDVTRSMAQATDAGSPHQVGARRAAARFVRGLPADRPVWLYAVGSGSVAQCQPVYRGARAAAGGERGPLLEEIASLPARGEGSLAAALDGVRGELGQAGPLAGSRVVVFSDLGEECAGKRSLCDAASRLVESGVSLDVVAIGARPAPDCLRGPDALAGIAGPAPPARAAAPVRVIATGGEPVVVGCSESGGLPIAVPAGPGAVVVGLEPPLRVEKTFVANYRYRLQVLDFPTLQPPERKWRWIVERPPQDEGTRP